LRVSAPLARSTVIEAYFAPKGGSEATSAWFPYSRGANTAEGTFKKHLPDALTRHNRNLSPSASLHKAPGMELASRLWTLPTKKPAFVMAARDFRRDLSFD
jgi:hypothetical protein